MWSKQLFVLSIFCYVNQVNASDLAMPQTAAEISQLLVKPEIAVEEEFESKSFSQEDKGFDKIINDLPPNLPRTGAVLQFNFGSAVIQAQSHRLLQEYGKALVNDLKDAVLLIAGYTDDVGNVENNLELSQKRAEAVRNFLLSIDGIDESHLIPKGFGEEQPIDTNTTEEGRALNRRVEFIRLK